MRIGVIGTIDRKDVIGPALDALKEENPDLVIVGGEGSAAGEVALAWAASAGVGHELVPAGKVVALSDSVIALVADEAEGAELTHRAESGGKPVSSVRVEGQAQGARREARESGGGIDSEVG